MKLTRLKERIELALMPLINTRLLDIGRAHTLEWIIFRSPDPTNGKSLTPIEYAINIQCTWRITGPEGIVVASDDLYFRAGSDPFYDLENFDWAEQGSNRSDERTSLFKDNISKKAFIVTSVVADSIGGLSILFNEDYSLEIFPANSLDREYWRFFNRHSSGEHFVVTGKGIEPLSDPKLFHG
jgi:hypothetical protein